MCECSKAYARAGATIKKVDRRALAKLMAGAAGTVAMTGTAEAATVTALAITCT